MTLTSLRFFDEKSECTTLTDCKTSQSEKEFRRLREKQHKARLNMAKHPRNIALNREQM